MLKGWSLSTNDDVDYAEGMGACLLMMMETKLKGWVHVY